MIPQISTRPRVLRTGAWMSLVLVVSLGACASSKPAMTRYVWMPESVAESKAAAPADTPAPVTERWLEGSIGQIATPQERERFSALETDSARAAFAEEFWASRDPDPASPHNEFRQEFERRARAADAVFSNGDMPGSNTLFGLALMVFGYPYDVSVNPHRDGGMTENHSLAVPTRAQSGDEIVWAYVPDGVESAGPRQLRYVQFGYVRGAWRMTCGSVVAYRGWALDGWRVAANPSSGGFSGGGNRATGSGSAPANYDANGVARSSGSASPSGYRGGGYYGYTGMSSSIGRGCFSFLLEYGGVPGTY